MVRLAVFACCLLLSVIGSAAEVDRIGIMRAAIELACNAEGRSDLNLIGRRLPGVVPVDPLPQATRLVNGWRRVYPLAIGHLVIDWLAPRGQLHHIRLQLERDDQGTPGLYALVNAYCKIKAARHMRYDRAGRAIRIDHLNGMLVPAGRQEAIDPPIPPFNDPGGIPVAIVDTGVNYTLPSIGSRLARDGEGQLIGYDYWDLDGRPFDANPERSPFFPARHGTEVASLIVNEAPIAKLLPYRYPRSDMARFGDLIDHAAAEGVRVMNISLVSFHRPDWRSFEEAMSRHPGILFVVAAGNDHRDIDARPVYPAALDHQNMITVTAAKSDGALAKDANWGRQSVDLMVPAHQIEVTDFDGKTRMVTGSSYGAARITSLVACLLAAYPDWTTARIKTRIFSLAVETKGDPLVAKGFVPEAVFGHQGACSIHRPNAAI